MITTIRIGILMIGTMINIMLMINSTTIQNQIQKKEKYLKLRQKRRSILCKLYPKNKNKRVIRKTKISLNLKKKLLTKRKKKRVHLPTKSKLTKLSKDNSMFKMQKMKIQIQINKYLISTQKKKNLQHLMKKIHLRRRSLCREFQSRIRMLRATRLKPI